MQARTCIRLVLVPLFAGFASCGSERVKPACVALLHEYRVGEKAFVTCAVEAVSWPQSARTPVIRDLG